MRLGQRRLLALVAGAIVVAVGVGLIHGLNEPVGPSASGSPLPATPGPSPDRSAGPSPSAGVATPVVDAAPVDARHGWALTHDDLVSTDDGGATWRSIRPGNVAASTIRAVYFLDTRDGWVASWSPDDPAGRVTVNRTSDSGRTWMASHVPDRYLDGVGITSIDAIDPGTIWVQVQGVGSSASSFGGLYLSQDGGISWVPGITIPGGWPVRFSSPSDGWTFARPLRDELEVTADAGRTWQRAVIDPPPGHERDDVAFDLPTFTGDLGILLTGILPVTLYGPPDVVTGDRATTLAIYTTSDGGATWRFAASVGQTTALGEGATIASAILDPQEWLVASDPEKPALSRTTDGGRTWTDLEATGLDGFVDALRFVDATDGWALTQREGSNFHLSATSDGGRTWRPLDPVGRATAVPSPTPTAAARPYRWTLVSSEGMLATYAVEQVLRRRDGAYLAIAFGQDARILASPDGRTWTVEPADAGLLEASANHLSLVSWIAEGTSGFVAVGATAFDDISSGDARAWTSPDGIHWRAAERSAGMTDADMEAVTAGPDGYVAVGSDGFPGGNTQLPGARGAAAWVSTDGMHWTRAPAQPSFTGTIMTGLTREGSGYVAWGETIPNDPAPALAPIWTSRDGLHWDRAEGAADAGGPGASIARILSIPGGLVAVGTRRLADAAGGWLVPGAWTSTDGGRTWVPSPVDGDSTEAARSGGLWDVAADGSSLVAVGRLEAPDGQSGASSAAVWRSADRGRTWTRLPDDPSFANAGMSRILPVQAGFAVFGHANDPNAYESPDLIWVAEPSP